MPAYLSYQFEDNSAFVKTYDELPLWSASFGLLLLKHLPLKPNMTVLDIGSGTGFPLLELAERLGTSCKLYGLDPWNNANERLQEKIKNYQIKNAQVIEGSAEQIPFDDQSIDLIVSNLGINNFDQPQTVFKECNRVLKKGGRLALTTNLNGHWKEFYDIFEATLRQLGMDDMVAVLDAHIAHRGTIETISKLYIDSGFRVSAHFEESFEMRFLDGTAFLNHHFVKLGWLDSWKGLLPAIEIKKIFSLLEENLNLYSAKTGGLKLTVPMAYLEAENIR